MKTEYELIKEDYGERFAKFCRSSFPTLIEEGVLYKTISCLFAPSKYLYDDIVDFGEVSSFINYINTNINSQRNIESAGSELSTPQELMLKAGYILYECKTEEEICQRKVLAKVAPNFYKVALNLLAGISADTMD